MSLATTLNHAYRKTVKAAVQYVAMPVMMATAATPSFAMLDKEQTTTHSVRHDNQNDTTPHRTAQEVPVFNESYAPQRVYIRYDRATGDMQFTRLQLINQTGEGIGTNRPTAMNMKFSVHPGAVHPNGQGMMVNVRDAKITDDDYSVRDGTFAGHIDMTFSAAENYSNNQSKHILTVFPTLGKGEDEDMFNPIPAAYRIENLNVKGSTIFSFNGMDGKPLSLDDARAALRELTRRTSTLPAAVQLRTWDDIRRQTQIDGITHFEDTQITGMQPRPGSQTTRPGHRLK